MILLIDNYDSFTFNLYQMLSQYERVEVIRNDGKTVEEIEAMKPAGIVLSPGPGRPENSGICPQVIRSLRGKIPILGVCLGEQAICQVYGGTVSHAIKPMHGRQSEVDIVEDSELFKGLGRKMKVARYHSLIAEEEVWRHRASDYRENPAGGSDGGGRQGTEGLRRTVPPGKYHDQGRSEDFGKLCKDL